MLKKIKTCVQKESCTRVLIVLAQPKETSYLSAVATAVSEELQTVTGVQSTFISLYQEDFQAVYPLQDFTRRFSLDPCLQRYYHLVQKADVLVFLHPLWWGTMPAILKGFLDRVFISSIAFELTKDKENRVEAQGLLTGKKLLVALTADDSYSSPLPIEQIWKKDIAQFCGFSQFSSLVFTELRNSTYEQRRLWIEQVKAQAKQFVYEKER